MPELPDLDQVIAAVSGSDDPLQQLAEAARIRDQLDDLGESLLDHYVAKARDAGCSWSQVGGVLGVTKQAAQQRHPTADSLMHRLVARFRPGRAEGGQLSRFTDRARRAIVAAEVSARQLQHHYLGTEHLLLGVLSEPASVGAKALARAGVTIDAVEQAIVDDVGRGPRSVDGQVPFTPRSKRVLERALSEALELGHNYIGTEHIVLALFADEKALAVEILRRLGVERGPLRATILELLANDTQ